MPDDDRPSTKAWGKMLAAGGLAVAALGLGIGLFMGDDGSGGAQPEAPAAADTTGGSQTGSGEPEPESAEPASPTSPSPTAEEIQVLTPPLMLSAALAEVSGFGAGGVFSTVGGGKNLGVTKGGGKVWDVAYEQASCGFTGGVVVYLGGEVASGLFEPTSFSAALFADANNHVSIAAVDGVVTGGFSTGGEGRKNHQEWGFSGGDLKLSVVQVDETTVEVDEQDRDAVALGLVATWSGTSTENFTGDEAAGTVTFTCVFLARG